MIKKKNIPTILGIVILLVGTFAGVFFLGMRQIFKVGADTSVAPQDIRTSNVSDNTATISWTTDKESTNFINWGESVNSLSKIEKETDDDKKFSTHSITISGLKPNTKYFYKINSEGESFDNKGIPWEFTTGQNLNVNTNSVLISGTILTSSGQPVDRALVYANVSGYFFSTLTSNTGNFVFQLSSARSQDLGSYLNIDESLTLVQISVTAGLNGVSSAQIFPQSGRPMPPIILGQVYDFRNLEPSINTSVPNATLNLPDNIEKESKFSVSIVNSVRTPTSVILESLKDGEIVTSDKPAFFGRGPGEQTINISINSANLTDTMQIAKDGTWTWSTPSNLNSGTHSITISWVDDKDITRNLTRNFVVQAGEVPSFEATPSQTLAPSPTGTPSATVIPTATPVPTPLATPIPVPVTGEGMPTVLIFVFGLFVIMYSLFTWKYSGK